MTDADFDAEYAEQQLTIQDTIAWDEIYARACRQATDTGFAQLIHERGSANYASVSGRDPDALKIARPRGAKVHVYPGLGRVAVDGAGSTTRQYRPEAPGSARQRRRRPPVAELAHSHSR